MKNLKYLYLTVAAVVLLFGCDPLEDTYAELDKEELEKGSEVSFAYTLSSDDYDEIVTLLERRGTKQDSTYASFVDSHGAFSTGIDHSNLIPLLLSDLYPHLGDQSKIQVKYNKFQDDVDGLNDFINAREIYLGSSDYIALGGKAEEFEVLSSEQTPEVNIPAILQSRVQDVLDGQTVLVRYDYVETIDVPTPVALFKELPEDLDTADYSSVNIIMEEADYQKIVDYTQTEKGDDWIDSFGTLEYYFGSNSFFKNFDARIDEATGGSVNNRKAWISEKGLDDDIFEGSTGYTQDSARVEARIKEGVLRYLSLAYPTEKSEMKNLYHVTYNVFYGNPDGNGNLTLTRTTRAVFDQEEDPGLDKDFRGDYFVYNGSEWEKEESVRYISNSEYAAMGLGRFNNFSESSPPEVFIPELLEETYEFSEEGDMANVGYRYYNGSATLNLVEAYTYTSGEWVGSLIEENEEQYVFGEGQWNLDPTIVFTLASVDYQSIVDEVKKTRSEFVDGNAEDYYGADPFYVNFDIRPTSRTTQEEYAGLSADEQKALINTRVGEGLEVLMEVKYGEQEPQVNGIDVFAILTAATYDGTDGTLVTRLQCVAKGDWKVVEGPAVPE